MRFRDLLRNINNYEQKLENVLLYVDFLPDHTLPLILMKDGALLILFELGGLDYEGLSEEEKQQYSYYTRTALEQLPDEGAGFMLSNLLVRDTPEPISLKSNPNAHPLIQFVQDNKQRFWDGIVAAGDAGPWNQVELSVAGPSIDFVILHWDPGGTGAPGSIGAAESLTKPAQAVDIAEQTRALISRYA